MTITFLNVNLYLFFKHVVFKHVVSETIKNWILRTSTEIQNIKMNYFTNTNEDTADNHGIYLNI